MVPLTHCRVLVLFLLPVVAAFSPLFNHQEEHLRSSSSILLHRKKQSSSSSSAWSSSKPPSFGMTKKKGETPRREKVPAIGTIKNDNNTTILKKNRTHPRNSFQGSYDMEALCLTHPPLAKFIVKKQSARLTIAFDNPQAVRALNAALLASDYNITSWQEHLPPSSLCPPVPGRADYIHYIADVLAESTYGVRDSTIRRNVFHEKTSPIGVSIRGLDIGTGASLIYPLIGTMAYGWSFVATDINTESVQSATRIAAANNLLQVDDDESSRCRPTIDMRLQTKKGCILGGILRPEERIDFCMCNPPFYESQDAYEQESARKIRNLAASRGSKRQQQQQQRRRSASSIGSNNFGGSASELWCPGGEVAFISTLIEESYDFSHQCLWFSSLVSRRDHLPLLQAKLAQYTKKHNQRTVQDTRVVAMGQGQKSSTILFWSFHNRDEQREWCLEH